MEKINVEEFLWNSVELKEKKIVYVAIIWRPNVWKSTFLNTLIWEKISIVSKVPQTTRNKILAIYNDEESQIIFSDTPWIHDSEKNFNKEINMQAKSSINTNDIVLYFIDTSRPLGVEEKKIQELLLNVKTPIIKVYTKIDLRQKVEITSDDDFKISSETKEGFDELISKIKDYSNFWTTPYPEDYYTKQDIYFRISEIIREKVFIHTKEEIPHSTFIQVGEIDDKEEILKIVAYIYTETESQKYIVIWKAGQLITKIWKEARIELEGVFGKKVFLALRVKKKEKWRNDKKFIKSLF